MDFLAVILIAIGLAMDALAVSLCKGMAIGKPSKKEMLTIGLWFGGFQGFMPVIGYFIGSSFYSYISEFDHWIAAILLWIIGFNMIRESIINENEGIDSSIDVKTMLVLAIATSIDALAVGISLAMNGEGILYPALIIGIITLIISTIGTRVGGAVGDKFGKKAELLGGFILIIIGIKILIEHLGLI